MNQKIDRITVATLLAALLGPMSWAQDMEYHNVPTGISPNSERIIFQSWEIKGPKNALSQLLSMNTDGTDVRRELRLGVGEGWPSFTRDGKRAVLFTQLKLGGDAELMVLDLTDPNDLSSYKRVTRLTFGESDDYFPSWSPDGAEIVFYGYRHGDQAQIYVMDVAGGSIRNISNNGVHESDPTWSIRGDITFESHADGNADIWVMQGDGSGRRNLTNHPAEDHWGDWSPDGNQLVFSSNRTGSENLFIMNRDGTGLRQLTNSNETDRWPRWAPDGSYIVFDRNTRTGSNVVLINPDGSGERQLTTGRPYHTR